MILFFSLRAIFFGPLRLGKGENSYGRGFYIYLQELAASERIVDLGKSEFRNSRMR